MALGVSTPSNTMIPLQMENSLRKQAARRTPHAARLTALSRRAENHVRRGLCRLLAIRNPFSHPP